MVGMAAPDLSSMTGDMSFDIFQQGLKTSLLAYIDERVPCHLSPTDNDSASASEGSR